MINFEQELNQEQLRVVKEASGSALVLAGAGSGKTRTIVYRVAYLLEQGVKPSEILLLTFTNKAANEMVSRIEYLIGRGAKDIWGGTFHSVSARILRKYGYLIGFKPNFTILDEDDARSLIKVAVSESGIDTKSRRFPAPAVLKSIFSLSENTKKSISEIIEWKHPSFIKISQEIQNVFRTYTDRKRANNSMDFDDLLLNFVLLLNSQPSVREGLQAKWKHILVDEYQDTNELQGDFIRLLYDDPHPRTISKELYGTSLNPPPLRGGGEEGEIVIGSMNSPSTSSGTIIDRSLIVVGDDAQSIYSFRGATVENILRFPKQYPNTKIYRLETNYRSVTPILDLANQIITQNTRQYEKQLRGLKPKGEKPVLLVAPTQTHEAEFIAEKILELRDEGIAMRNMAVLFRASHHSEALEFELAKRDIPYEYRGGMKFFERAHIKDVLAFLRIVSNNKDEVSWLRVLGMQAGIGGVGAGRIFSIINQKEGLKGITSLSSLGLSNRVEEGWKKLSYTFKALEEQEVKPAVLIGTLLDSFYEEYLESEYPDWRERLEDLEQLKVFASTYERLDVFVGDLSLYENFSIRKDAEATRDDERLVLSTIHQAKGLEWDAVFIINLTNASFPNRRAFLEEGGIEEERRLFYVAVTRARKLLSVSYPQIGGIDSAFLNQPSMFLSEVDEGLFKTVRIQNNDYDDGDEDAPDNDGLPIIDMGKRTGGYLKEY